MCGIAGIIDSQKRVALADLKRMARAIEHRGPDGEDVWTNQTENVGFGHRRLAILDLSDDGKQPMHYENGRYTIVFNGEIYNFIEIKERLEKKGFSFKSHCDTEVLLALFHEKKEKCLADLDGMFAFAIWDEREKRLFCARDRFGEKPFYYSISGGAFYFASEMKALWSVGVPRTVNNRMFFNFLAHKYLQNPNDLSETFFRGIYKLKAAHYFYITPENLNPEPENYWAIDHRNVNKKISEEEAAEEFRRLFYESVKRRLRSDVPVGSSLSGGLDSSLVVCVIDELKKNKTIPQATFSARFPGFAKDEGKYMQMVIDRTFVEPHFVYPDEAGLIEDLDKLFYHQEEPFNSASMYAQFCVMRLANEKGVTVLLDGQGADEFLAGYHSYFPHWFRELKARDKTLWKTELNGYAKLHANGKTEDGLKRRLKNEVRRFVPDSILAKIKDRKQRADMSRIFGADFLEAHFEDVFSQKFMPPETLAEAMHKTTFQGELEDLLRYSDRNSMAHSREVRLPFLSFELTEFLSSLPPHFKIRNGVTKFVMREAFKDILPSGIVQRHDKIGYEPPQKKWLENPQVDEKLKEATRLLIENKIINPNLRQTSFSNNFEQSWNYLMGGKLLAPGDFSI